MPHMATMMSVVHILTSDVEEYGVVFQAPNDCNVTEVSSTNALDVWHAHPVTVRLGQTETHENCTCLVLFRFTGTAEVIVIDARGAILRTGVEV